MSTIYTELVDNMQTWSVDAEPVLEGSCKAFSAAKVDRMDPVLSKLLEPVDTDGVT